MIAGQLALLEDTADERLEPVGGDAFATLDVRETQEYLDEGIVQAGRACGRVTAETEHIYVDGTTIETEREPSRTKVYTEWVADVVDGGFVAASRTAATDDSPPFPFDLFESVCGTDVRPARLDPTAFVARQHQRDRDLKLWFSGEKERTGETEPNNVAMGYGVDANDDGGNVGVGFHLPWEGTVARGVLWASGYVALYRSTWDSTMFARFVREEVLPVAEIVQDESEQATLTDDACRRCERESDSIGPKGYCVTCRDLLKERGEL